MLGENAENVYLTIGCEAVSLLLDESLVYFFQIKSTAEINSQVSGRAINLVDERGLVLLG